MHQTLRMKKTKRKRYRLDQQGGNKLIDPVLGMVILVHRLWSGPLRTVPQLNVTKSVAKWCLTLLRPHGLQPTGSIGFLRQEYWIGLPFPSPLGN